VIETLGVLLAGGRGSRLGESAPKAFVRVGGESLLARAARTLAEVCDEVLVTGPGDWSQALGAEAPATRFAADPADAQGPLAGVVVGLTAVPFRRALVLGVDFPLARSAALAALLAWLSGAGLGTRPPARAAVVPTPGSIPQPLFAAYAPAAAAGLAAALAGGERSIVRAVRTLDPWLVPEPELLELPGGLDNFVNVNTPDDRIDVERRLAALATKGASATKGALP